MIEAKQRPHFGAKAGLRVLAAACATVTALAAHGADTDTKKMDLGRQVFTKTAEPQCGVCHTLKDAGTTGEIGAKLEEIKPDVDRVMAAVREGVGVMPSYAGKLTDAQIQAVAYYVSRVVQGKN